MKTWTFCVAAALALLAACSKTDREADRPVTFPEAAVAAADSAAVPNPAAHGEHQAGRAAGHGEHTDASAGAHADHAGGSEAAHAGAGHAPAHTARGHTPLQHTPNAAHEAAAHVPEHMAHDTAAHAPEHLAHDAALQTPQHGAHAEMEANMIMGRIGSFDLMTMAQVFPTFTFSAPASHGTPLERTGFYLTQPAISANLSSPRSVFVVRTTLNFEGITQEEGELTFGAWGEGYLDKRHPHTLLHEFMLSYNLRGTRNAFSLSAGKGFAPYGTDDPMSRPLLKYPTNHHLSQALERWTVIGAALLGTWSVEGSVFGGTEPTSPYDFSNIESFPNSWSARLTKRFGMGQVGTWPWELSLSHAYVVEEHEGEAEHTRLFNAAVRHEHDHGPAHMYSLIEASRAKSEHGEPYFSLLAETSVRVGKHLPYARIEYATRPEYPREGTPGERGFFRYDHDDEAIGATRWLIISAGYGLTLTSSRVSPRPYIEAQYNRAWSERGGIEPRDLFGRDRFWSISAGMRIFVGGEPMRMGSYGILDAMTAMHDTPTLHAMSKHRH